MGGTTQAICYLCHECDDCIYNGDGWICSECHAKLNPPRQSLKQSLFKKIKWNLFLLKIKINNWSK